jgi:hypothetical protein
MRTDKSGIKSYILQCNITTFLMGSKSEKKKKKKTNQSKFQV